MIVNVQRTTYDVRRTCGIHTVYMCIRCLSIVQQDRVGGYAEKGMRIYGTGSVRRGDIK